MSDRDEAIRDWAARWAVSRASTAAIIARASVDPAAPPFTGLPEDARRELGVLSLQCLRQLRELTHPDHPPQP